MVPENADWGTLSDEVIELFNRIPWAQQGPLLGSLHTIHALSVAADTVTRLTGAA